MALGAALDFSAPKDPSRGKERSKNPALRPAYRIAVVLSSIDAFRSTRTMNQAACKVGKPPLGLAPHLPKCQLDLCLIVWKTLPCSKEDGMGNVS